MNAYPNPFRDMVQLDLDLDKAYTGPVYVEVFNLAGRQLQYHSSAIVLGGKGQMQLDLAGEPSGYYLLQVRAGARQLSTVIQKQ
jgi:hypothetical protein